MQAIWKKVFVGIAVNESSGCHNPIRDCVDVLHGKVYPRSGITVWNLHILFTSCSSHVTTFYTEF